MSKNLAEILAANVEYLKVNNIEKAIGLNKTALVRMIARKEIPDKRKDKIMKWWTNWVAGLISPVIEENNKPEKKEQILKDREYLEKKKIINDMFDFGMAAHKTDEKGEVTHIPIMSKDGLIVQQIADDEAELKTIPDTGLGKKRKEFLNKRINNLKRQLNGRAV